jgi:DNA-directed RNA polymerase specialized sigma24 family protein
MDAKLARMVELRFFGGLTIEEIAEIEQVNERTIRRDWTKAKALLQALLEQ